MAPWWFVLLKFTLDLTLKIFALQPHAEPQMINKALHHFALLINQQELHQVKLTLYFRGTIKDLTNTFHMNVQLVCYWK